MKKTRSKRYSIIIVPDDGSKVKKYTLSQTAVNVLKIFSICILLGIIGLFFEYGSIIQKNLKIRSLEAHNKELVERYGKLQIFEEEFRDYKGRMLKLANMLGVESAASIPPARISVTPTAGETSEYKLPSVKPTGVPLTGEVKYWLSRSFSQSHTGIDFATSSGTPVLSTMRGVVSFTGWNDTLGYMVKISDSTTGYTTVYAHLTKFVVTMGKEISTGATVGYVGSTGKSSAPHLHYEVLLHGVSQDPKLYLSK